MLENANIPHESYEYFNGINIAYPNKSNCVCSVIEHDGSYGRHVDKIEISGLLTKEESEYDSVAGWLTAEDVFNRITAHYNRL